jgi:hypothetical protein
MRPRPFCLAAIERSIGLDQDLVDRGAVRRGQCDSDRHPDLDGMAGDFERARQLFQHAARQHRGHRRHVDSSHPPATSMATLAGQCPGSTLWEVAYV